MVTDLRMPGLDGLELLAQLHARAPDLPVILLSGRCDAAIARQAMQAGATDVLHKPCTDDALLGAIRRALSCHAGRED